MSFTFEKATRKKVKLKVLIDGPSGAGKTIGALNLARGLVGPTGRVALIDSEKDRSEYYADRYEFDKLSLTDLRCVAYEKALQAAVDAGYDAVVIDSLSHAWLDVLTRKDAYDAANPSSNRFTNWQKFSHEWERLIRFILECPAHVVCTARSKQAHEQIEENGKKKVVKLGLAPQLREGTEYEFAVTFSLNDTHRGEATKDNTFLFGDKTEPIDLLKPSVAKRLNDWLASGNAVQPTKPTPAAPTKPDAPVTIDTVREAFAKARTAISCGEELGKWAERIAARIPGDLIEAVRQDVGVSDLATGSAVWAGWTPEMLDKGKQAVTYWLDNVKA